MNILRQNIQKNLVTKFIDDDLGNENFAPIINQWFHKIDTIADIAAGGMVRTAMRKIKDKIRIEDNLGREIAFGQLPKTKKIWGQNGSPSLSLFDWLRWL